MKLNKNKTTIRIFSEIQKIRKESKEAGELIKR